MPDEPYYTSYEKRYQAVYSAGVDRWGHSPEDTVLYETLQKWVKENDLIGRRVIEYACGEGACGVILSELGCIYYGVDISPSAIEKARKTLEQYPNATVEVRDMVREPIVEQFDAALDCMGLHMLITDEDRNTYLNNAFNSLNTGAPMLFFRESYRKEGAYHGNVKSIEEWEQITGDDYATPQLRQARLSNGDVTEVYIPLVPARAKDESGYALEMKNARFTVESFIEMSISSAIPFSASIFVRKKV